MVDRFVKYAKSVGTYFGATLIPMVLMALVNPLIAMNMSPEDYAVSGYYSSFAALFSPVIVFYLINYYNKRYYETSLEERLRLRALLFKALIFFSGAVSLLCLAALAAFIFFLRPDFEFPFFPYAALMVFAIPLTGIYKLEQAEFRMSRDASGYFRLTVTAGVVLVVANLLFVVLFKMGAVGKLLAPLTANLLMFSYLLYKHRSLFSVRTDLREFRTVLAFCLPLAFGAMLGYFFNGYDRTYLETLSDTSEYGNYIVGSQIAGYLTSLSTAVTSTFQPDLYESVARKNRGMLLRSCSLQIAVIALGVAVFVLFCPLVVRLLTAGRYVAAAPYARIIAFSTLASSLYFILNNYTIAKGYPRLYLYTTLVGSVITMLAYPPVVEAFGYKGGALMTSVSYIILIFINIIFLSVVRLFRARRC
ncbi:MAG: lipopolysaccharide biosynthesis protein [Candidatus Cryptobacteroides sp.]